MPTSNWVLHSGFYCHAAKLVIEIDGKNHTRSEQKFNDDLRTEDLEILGITVIRFTNKEVEDHLDIVLKKISESIKEKISSSLKRSS
jgi:very-short-patch-repair endonuclease